MVSTGQMVGMIMAMLLPVVVAAVIYIAVYRHSRKIETGMPGALGYGFLGYLWQQLFYLMVVVLLSNVEAVQNLIENYYMLLTVFYGLICAVFVALGLYWGIYLTNQKQQSLYRSVTVGIGFGMGNVAWNIFAAYGMSFFYAVRINSGNFTGSEQTKASILATPTATMYLDAFKCILLLIIYVGVAYIMSGYYLEGRRAGAWFVPIAVQLFISLINAGMKQYMPETASKIGIYIVLCLMTGASLYLIFKWLRTSNRITV